MAGPAKTATAAPRARKTAASPAEEQKAGAITEHQMRHLHVLLHENMLTDRDDILEWLSLLLGHEVESRKSLTTEEADTAIDALLSAKGEPTPAKWAALARPFPKDQIEVKPQQLSRDDNRKDKCDRPYSGVCADDSPCGGWHARSVHLTYVGHAGVTMRLNEVDPSWSWEPLAYNNLGLPMVADGVLWIRLTILGVSRIGVGDAQGKSGANAVKEMVGDAIRNAAMRFGVATYLWSKSQAAAALAASEVDESYVSQETPPWVPGDDPIRDGAADTPQYPSTADVLARIDRYAAQQGIDRERITAKWREQQGGLTTEELETLPASSLVPLADAIAQYIEQQGGRA